jgi:hypothetical protein
MSGHHQPSLSISSGSLFQRWQLSNSDENLRCWSGAVCSDEWADDELSCGGLVCPAGTSIFSCPNCLTSDVLAIEEAVSRYYGRKTILAADSRLTATTGEGRLVVAMTHQSLQNTLTVNCNCSIVLTI